MSQHVAAIGDNCLDVYIEQDALTVGGNALNVAVNWASAGLPAVYFGAVGDDPASDVVLEVLEEAGLDRRMVEVTTGPTGVTLIRLVDSDRQFVFEELGVGALWRPDNRLVDLLSTMAWVHVGGPLATTDVAEQLGAAGARVSVDLSTTPLSESLRGVEIAFGSWSTADLDGAERVAARMTSLGARLGVVTCGEHGSLVHDGRDVRFKEAEPAILVDTCGAGDSYIAAFVAAHLRGEAPTACLEAATAAATGTCFHLGGFVQRSRAVPAWVKEQYYRRVGIG